MKVSSLSEIGFSNEALNSFFQPIAHSKPASRPHGRIKITIVGCGKVGMAIAQTILTQGLADEIALVDCQPEKLRGEMLDLQHAAAFMPRVNILSSTEYLITADSDLAIITAGARQKPSESRLDLLQRNVATFKTIVPPLADHSPHAILLVVSNPVDVLTYITWKLSKFPPNRVLGSGTNLDSSRFKFLLADHFKVNAHDVQAYVVGEHGDNSVALWSSISIGGAPVLSSMEKNKIKISTETLEAARKSVVDSAYEVIKLKGYTSWAIGYSVASIAFSLLRDQRRIHPVSVLAKGFYDISDENEVFLSLPSQLGRGGVLGVASVELTEEEANRLRQSVVSLSEYQSVMMSMLDDM